MEGISHPTPSYTARGARFLWKISVHKRINDWFPGVKCCNCTKNMHAENEFRPIFHMHRDIWTRRGHPLAYMA